MAATTIPANLVPKIWSRSLWVEALGKLFFTKFIGKEEPTADKTRQNALTDIVNMKTELEKQPGDAITFGLAYQLSAAGRAGADAMEGQEEAIAMYDQRVTIDRIRNAVLWDEVRQGQFSPYNIRSNAKSLLSDWLAAYIDKTTITALTTSPTSTRVLYGGDATSTATIDSSDTFSTSLIDAAVRKAKTSTPKIRPVMVDGKPWYVILAHPFQIASLRSETAWKEAQQYANVRGIENPIFTGAAGYYAGAVIHEYERIPTYSDWGSGSDLSGARAVLLGGQAGLWAFGKKSYWKERETDYDSVGVQVGSILGIAKAKFNNIDYGVIALDTYAAETYPSATS